MNLNSVTNYCGVTCNVVRKYDLDGALSIEYFQNNDKIEGTEIIYNLHYYQHHNKICILSIEHYIDNKKHGTSNGYYDNGLKMDELYFINNNMNGLYKYYDRAGIFVRDEYYINNILQFRF